MAIKLHGTILSPPVLRVVTCLKEKELNYEFVNVNLQAGEHKQPHFLALNPFGEVPTFEDGDLKLFESRAITQYIAHTYVDKGTQLILPDHKKMAIMSVWMEVEAQKFHPAASKLSYEIVIKPLLGMKTDDAVLAQYEEQLGKVLDVYEVRLKESKYLGGDCFTLVDLHHIPIINYLMGTKVKALFDARPKVSAWIADILARPAWAKVQELLKQKLGTFK
ncbi:PREDICTED: glutathione S-transferase-like [Ipomoea nil]|uniref:glutathione S-transferase-like n=1 Tax=Ipomoea nil TaxID=35883 RepID=UPI000901BB73|nr:PREDICTED: glutathione S-transferase-like [Ipomoea nil]